MVFSAARASQSEGKQPALALNRSGSGTEKTATFASSGGWNLAPAFDCSEAGGLGTFVLDVYNADKRHARFEQPGVNQQGSAGSDVLHFNKPGRFYLEITTTCRWTVKVTSES